MVLLKKKRRMPLVQPESTGKVDGHEPLIFFVNGRKICEPKPDPGGTLLQYLRRKLWLPGTKEGCGHGGCGSCTVMVSKYDVIKNHIKHYAVNACLFPLCAAHGLAITTVEGVGNPATGLHAVQQRLIESHGLQCGFCTPGFVMSAFALLRNHPKPTREQIERAIEGNLCRCTGYRPLMDALFAFSETKDTRADEKQVPIFPPELQLRCEELFRDQLRFSDDRFTWYRPVQLHELLILKDKFPTAPLVMGNTSTGRLIAKGEYDGVGIIIYGGSIQELKTIALCNDGLTVGGACTISELSEYLEDMDRNTQDQQNRHIPVIKDMVSSYGAEQIRNVSTIAGSIMCGLPNSDVKTLLEALDATVHTASVERSRQSKISELKLESNEVITSVLIPSSSPGEFSAFYKHSDRRSFSLAKVNAGMLVRINAEQKVSILRFCFGDVSKYKKTQAEVSNMSKGRFWDSRLLHDVLAVITNVLSTDSVDKEDRHKMAVVSAFWFKFYNKVQTGLKLCEPDKSLTSSVSFPPYHSRQVFDACTADNQPTDDAHGRNVPNIHSEAVVSGEAIFVDDIPEQKDELFLGLVLSSKARAKILHVDPSSALALPGVLHYIDHRDIPGKNNWGLLVPDEELFCSGEVTSVGQILGGIIGTTRETALKAVPMVEVAYEEMTPILTIEEAIVHHSFYGDVHRFVDGDFDHGLAESDHVIEGEYKTGLQEHFYMEPQAALAIPKENQELELNCTTHNLAGIQNYVSKLLNIPQNKITCKVKRLGGSFGGKDTQSMYVAGPAAIAALKTKRAVRCVLPRVTDMRAKGKRHPFLGKYKVGFGKNGKIKALDMKMYCNGGHSLDYSGLVMDCALTTFESGYKVNNMRLEGYVYKTNTPSNTAFRAFGHPQSALIMEDIIFQIANQLNITSEKVREVNLYQEGDVTTFGTKLEKCSIPELWQKCNYDTKFEDRLKDVETFNSENRWKKRGISMTACKYPIGFRAIFMNQGAALVNIYTDGSVLVAHGGVEMGQGLNTKLIQVASSVLGLPKEKIHTVESSTREIPNPIVTSCSMGTDLYGPAVKNACDILIERLAPLKDEMPDSSWETLILTAFFKRIQLSATGFNRPYKANDFDLCKKGDSPIDYFTYGVACTDVEIDILTGESQVLQSDLFMDIGKSLNPAIDIGQIEGAFVQGLGMMTSESMEIDEAGRTNNCNALSYKIPNIKSIPRKLNVHLIKNHDIVTNIHSSKATGEPPYLLSLSVISAIKEAVLHARAQVGKHGFFRLDSPATVQKIQEACGPQINTSNEA